MIQQTALWLDFPTDAAEELDRACAELLSSPRTSESVLLAVDILMNGSKELFLNQLEKIGSMTNLHRHTVDMVVLLLAIEPLRARYRSRGLDDALCRETMRDLSYKLAECRKVYGTCGTFVTAWYYDFYQCKLFSLGRLQYERYEFPYDAYGSHLRRGDCVYKCHIPSCGPVTEESVMDSLRRAHAFFADELRDGILPVFCSSWMLYPPHAEQVFPPQSNLRRFYDLFETLEALPRPDNDDYWRIFNAPYDASRLADAPEGTSLQRAFKSFLKNGNCMGSGRAILLFDGTRILPKEKT